MDISQNVLLSTKTTLRTGGPARFLFELIAEEQLLELSEWLRSENLPFVVVGGGSNILFAEKGFAGVVIKNELRGVDFLEQSDGSVFLTVAAGESLDEVVGQAVEKGYWGLENLSAIPGTVGATPVQNVGAYGVEVSSLIEKVEAFYLPTGAQKIFSQADCHFGYRDSFFKTTAGQNYLITSVTFRLSKTPQPKLNYTDLQKNFANQTPGLSEIRQAVINIRAEKFPDLTQVGTAGSFFKNPVLAKAEAEELLKKFPDLPHYSATEGLIKISLGFVLDKICGLKGFRQGEVELFSKQALVLVNYGHDNTVEVKDFVRLVQERVFAKTKLMIEPEVRFLGDDE